MTNAHWSISREIVERIVIYGDLKFKTPVAFGSGSDEGLTDSPLILDPLEGKALLTGASIAGALRSYLRNYEHGYRNKGTDNDLGSKLFGVHYGEEGSDQSWILTHDSLGEKPLLELRDGVKIKPKTRTAEDEKKFDFELIEAGAKFRLKFELLLPENEKLRNDLLCGLVICLKGLENEEISLQGLENEGISFGIRKYRGLGKCVVKEWSVYRYDLTTSQGLIDWLNNSQANEKKGKISDIIPDTVSIPDKRESFLINATFSIDGSMIIRSGSRDPDAPDMVHLHSKRNGTRVPIISGTALAGALRARGLRIAKTIGDKNKSKQLLDELFGEDVNNSTSSTPSASKLIVDENEINSSFSLVQNRIKIDRFTGSSFPTALFNEQPVFAKKETEVCIKLLIRQPDTEHIGLLLLLLKDLWTRDLPIGGESSVGRGRLIGKKAKLVYRTNSQEVTWEMVQERSKLNVTGNKEELEGFVKSFVEGVKL